MNTKIHHCDNKWYFPFLSKFISQIQCFLFNYFHLLYYHIISWVYVGVKNYCNHSVIYTLNTVEQHPSNHKILLWHCYWLLSLCMCMFLAAGQYNFPELWGSGVLTSVSGYYWLKLLCIPPDKFSSHPTSKTHASNEKKWRKDRKLDIYWPPFWTDFSERFPN